METPEFDDVGDAIREGRALRQSKAYRVLFAVDNIDFRPLAVADPIPLGRQILEAAGLEPERGYSLFAIVENGDFEDVRLDEPFDLRGAGAERFVAFLTDRDFKFEVNSHEERWGKPAISGQVLAALAKPGPDEAVFLEVRGGTDVLVEPTMLIDRDAPSVERFFSAPRPPCPRTDDYFRADRRTGLPRPARSERGLLHDLPKGSVDAARRRTGRPRRRHHQAGDRLQCHAHCSVVTLTSRSSARRVISSRWWEGSS